MPFHVVLMMSTYTRKTPLLLMLLIGAIYNLFFGGKRMIIRSIVMGFDTVGPQM